MPRKRNIYNVDFDNQQQDQENIKKNLLIANYMIRGRQEGIHFKWTSKKIRMDGWGFKIKALADKH